MIPYKKIFIIVFTICIAFGVIGRFHQITKNQFIYYDEGMWLNANRSFVSLVQSNPAKNIREFYQILRITAYSSLGTGKALWAFISSLRVYFAGAEGWYFVRIISAIFGTLTLFLIYLFSKKYYDSKYLGMLSMALLAVLPSHFYYSRIGLQEAFSTFCFILGLYVYLFFEKRILRVILAALFFSFVYFSNYRMIIIPGIIAFCEIFQFVFERKKIDYQKYVWTTVLFFVLVFTIGSIKVGRFTNTYITFAWMFHQKNAAKGHFDIINFLSYPYYLFKLEGFLFGIFFFGNVYFLIKRKWNHLLPFGLVLFLMIPFSMFQEKGVRYLCAVMPFMAVSVAHLIHYMYHASSEKFKRVILLLTLLMVSHQIFLCAGILRFHTDYQRSVVDMQMTDKNPKIISSQSMIQKLFVHNQNDVVELSSDSKDLIDNFRKGFKYLVIDPQAYVSLTGSQKRFDPQLAGYLQFVKKIVPPQKVYPHFSQALLERFVLEHNENLMQSLRFLKENKTGHFSSLYVYRLDKILTYMKSFSQK